MSAPTPAPGDESPREGFYPDPSIPGYVRYWNGGSWVPGTSRPAPQRGEAMPSAPAAEEAGPPPPGPAPVDETGPVFFDQEPYDDSRPEPSTAWQADASRQNGFGGERDRRVSWGGGGQPAHQGEQPEPGPDPRTPAGSSPAAGSPAAGASAAGTPVAGASADRSPAVRSSGDRSPAVRSSGDRSPAVRPGADLTPVDPRRPVRPEPTGGALPGMRDGGGGVAAESTVSIRATRPDRSGGPGSSGGPGGGNRDAGRPPGGGTVALRAAGSGRTPSAPRDAEQPPAEGTMSIRALGPAAAQAPAPAAPPVAQAPVPAPAAPASPRASAPPSGPTWQDPAAQASARLNGPLAPGPGGSWAQQAPQQARPEQAALPQAPAQQQRPAFPQQSQAPQPDQPDQPDQPVVPWKPPVNDHFQQLAAARAAARPAALGKRFAARLIDSVVLSALVGVIALPLATQATDHINEKIDAAKLSGETVTVWLLDSTTAGLAGAVLGVFLVLGVLLEALPTAKWGRTLGKKLCGIDVRDIESGVAPTFGAALRRWLVYGVLGVLAIGVVNVLWCLIDRPWRQCWHDKAAHTFVAG
ncbi:RDD family protein [Streptomyces brevispora]|uniref:RDD family protein n=1 Tax=Streptomyces brevispora TaxID=887462 RepID=UPI0033FF03A2